MPKKDSADRTSTARFGQAALGEKRRAVRLSVQGDFPDFAERTEERGPAGSIYEFVCDSTDVLSVFARHGKLARPEPAENTVRAVNSIRPLDTKLKVPIQFRR